MRRMVMTKESIGLVAENVSLVEIPWLKTSKKDEVTHATINDSPPLKRKGEEEDCIVPKKVKVSLQELDRLHLLIT